MTSIVPISRWLFGLSYVYSRCWLVRLNHPEQTEAARYLGLQAGPSPVAAEKAYADAIKRNHDQREENKRRKQAEQERLAQQSRQLRMTLYSKLGLHGASNHDQPSPGDKRREQIRQKSQKKINRSETDSFYLSGWDQNLQMVVLDQHRAICGVRHKSRK